MMEEDGNICRLQSMKEKRTETPVLGTDQLALPNSPSLHRCFCFH